MSDFDKEAERERLREKYGDEGRERESTRRMSELLLKGATMTDQHCERCGDPIFRYDGQAFCPTCQGEGADGAAATDQAPDAAAAGAESAPDAAAAGEESAPDAGATAAADGEADDASVEVETPPDAEPTGAADARSADADRGPDVPQRGPTAQPAGDEDEGAGDAGGRTAARASLERTLARFARDAEAAEDPRRARDLLAAAREAAEALAALDRR